MENFNDIRLADPQLKKLYNVLCAFNYEFLQSVLDLVDILNSYSAVLGRSEEYRQSVGEKNPGLWVLVKKLWLLTVDTSTGRSHLSPEQIANLHQGIAKFTRNLVAAVPFNQQNVFQNEPMIRSLIHKYTSYAAMQENSSFLVTRMLVQALANLVTANPVLLQSLWETYLSLPEEELVLLRLLSSPDARTISSTFVLILNCVYGSYDRTQLILTSPRGARLSIHMLDRLSVLVDEDPSSDGGQAFDLGYKVLSHVIEEGFAPDLYHRISMNEEIITPHQTTLLKLVDSHLQRQREGSLYNLDDKKGSDLINMLALTHSNFSAYTQRTIQTALGSGQTSATSTLDAVPSSNDDNTAPSQPLNQLDLLLPKVCEALVLVTQCLISLTLHEDENKQGESAKMRQFVVGSTSSSTVGFVESLIETLRLLDLFIPRITFGKVAPRPVPSESGNGVPSMNNPAQTSPPNPGFSYVKRDLVRLLGILSSNNRSVQDRVRECGGIPVVMNLCVVDDQNPYMKEHAIFTLRNLLYENTENQEIIKGIQPVGRWDEYGVMQTLGNSSTD